MSNILSRFRKQGGFFQLVLVIETCEPEKRKNLMKLVASENPGWAHLISKKILSLEKILAFPDHILMEILPHFSLQMLAVLYCGVGPDLRARIISGLSAKGSRDLQSAVDSYKASHKSATSDEFGAASVKLVQLVRDLEADNVINFQLFDPTLVIDPKIAS
jgi:flagellar motor switch protein FliG